MRPFVRVVWVAVLAVAGAIFVNDRLIPTHDIRPSRADTIIVLGYPTNQDGTPSPEQRERVLEGVHEYKQGVAPRMIVTGGAAHNHYTEAHVMAELARSQGVPAADVLEEPQAMNTIQNIYYSAQIMQQHEWHSAEVISSPSHLPRASLILQTFDREQPALSIHWYTHAAPWPREYNLLRRIAMYSVEATYCLRLRLLGFPHSRFLP